MDVDRQNIARVDPAVGHRRQRIVRIHMLQGSSAKMGRGLLRHRSIMRSVVLPADQMVDLKLTLLPVLGI